MDPTLNLGGSDQKTKGWQVDKKISVQHLITVVAMLLAGVTAFNTLARDVALNTLRITTAEAQGTMVKTDIQAALNELKAEIRDLRNEVKLFQIKAAKN